MKPHVFIGVGAGLQFFLIIGSSSAFTIDFGVKTLQMKNQIYYSFMTGHRR